MEQTVRFAKGVQFRRKFIISHVMQWIIPNIKFFPCNKTRYWAYIHRVKKNWFIFRNIFRDMLQSISRNVKRNISRSSKRNISRNAKTKDKEARYKPCKVSGVSYSFIIFKSKAPLSFVLIYWFQCNQVSFTKTQK